MWWGLLKEHWLHAIVDNMNRAPKSFELIESNAWFKVNYPYGFSISNHGAAKVSKLIDYISYFSTKNTENHWWIRIGLNCSGKAVKGTVRRPELCGWSLSP
jgi:hypothetical protein